MQTESCSSVNTRMCDISDKADTKDFLATCNTNNFLVRNIKLSFIPTQPPLLKSPKSLRFRVFSLHQPEFKMLLNFYILCMTTKANNYTLTHSKLA